MKTSFEYSWFTGQDMERSVAILVDTIDKMVILTNDMICHICEVKEFIIQYKTRIVCEQYRNKRKI